MSEPLDLISFYNTLVSRLSEMASPFAKDLWEAYAPVPALGHGGVVVRFTETGIEFSFEGWGSEGKFTLWRFQVSRSQVNSFPMTQGGNLLAVLNIQEALRGLILERIEEYKSK